MLLLFTLVLRAFTTFVLETSELVSPACFSLGCWIKGYFGTMCRPSWKHNMAETKCGQENRRSDRVTANSDTLGLPFLWHDEIIHRIRSGGGAAPLARALRSFSCEMCASLVDGGVLPAFPARCPIFVWWGYPAALVFWVSAAPLTVPLLGPACRSPVAFDGRLRLQSSRLPSSPCFWGRAVRQSSGYSVRSAGDYILLLALSVSTFHSSFPQSFRTQTC